MKIKSCVGDTFIVVDITDVVRAIIIVMWVGSSYRCVLIKRFKIFTMIFESIAGW